MSQFFDDGPFEQEEWDERVDTFARPGENSALRRASASNPRNRPCPTCGAENVLTPADVQKGYQCDHCADVAEGLAMPGADY